MYEYKVDIYKLKYAADAMNTYAKAGWRVIAVTPYHMDGFVDVFYEREVGTGTSEEEISIPESVKSGSLPEIPDVLMDIGDLGIFGTDNAADDTSSEPAADEAAADDTASEADEQKE